MAIEKLKMVKDIMTTAVYTVVPSDTVAQAFRLMTMKNVRHLPVTSTNKGHVVGVLSDRDIRRILGPSKKGGGVDAGALNENLNTKKVRNFVDKKVITIEPDAPVTHAASLMSQFKIGCLPVVEDKRLVGIITETDILHDYVRLADSLMKLAGGEY